MKILKAIAVLAVIGLLFWGGAATVQTVFGISAPHPSYQLHAYYPMILYGSATLLALVGGHIAYRVLF